MFRPSRILGPAILLGIAFPVAGHAQVVQRSVALNTPTLANEYLSVVTDTGLEGSPAMTIEAWVRPTSYTNFPTIVGNDYMASYWLGLSTSGQVRYYPRGGFAGYVQGAGIVPLNAWTHVAVTYNGTNTRIYLNGTLDVSSLVFSGAIGTSAGDVRIGADRELGAPDYFWRGHLDEVRIWSAARTQTQIRQTMYAGAGNHSMLTPAYTGLEAWWDMQSGTTTASDRVGLPSNNALLLGGAMTTAQAPPVCYNVGVMLNGTDDYWRYIAIPYDFTPGITVAAWIAPQALGSNQAIIARDYLSSFYFGLNPAGRLRFYPTGGAGLYVEGTTIIPIVNSWTHVAATYDGAVTRLYVNGELETQSTAIAGPVGENGALVYVGADRTIAGPSFFFNGIIDNVQLFEGPMTAGQIRHLMYSGYAAGTWTLADAGGLPRKLRAIAVDPFTSGLLQGSSARFVRSGAPIAAYSTGVFDARVEDFTVIVPPWDLYLLPDGTGPGAPSISAVSFDLAGQDVVTDVDVLVVAATTDLSHARLTLTSPTLTTVTLLPVGMATGRDLHTIFADSAPVTLASGVSPYVNGVIPSSPLSTFRGENVAGRWWLELTMDPGHTEALWTAALRVRGGPVGVEAGAGPREVALRNSGQNPVRGTGSLALSLPRDADVELALCDLAGRRVRTLPAGTHSVSWNSAGLAPGVYFVTLRLDGVETRSISLVVLQ